MKKVVVSFIAGAVMATAATAYGEETIESLIGKQIQGQTTVYNDGEPLDVALIVDGKSYAPIRSLAEATGKDVDFGDGEIFLTTPDTQTEQPADVPASESPIVGPTEGGEQVSGSVSIEEKIQQIDSRIKVNQSLIKVDRGLLEVNDNWTQEEKDRVAADIAKLEAEITELQAQKAALEAQLTGDGKQEDSTEG